MIKENELNYIAGLLDGEGYIGVRVMKNNHQRFGYSIQPIIAISVSRTDGSAIFEIKKLLGMGTIDNKTRFQTTLRIRKKSDVKRFIQLITPYVRFPSAKRKLALLNQIMDILGERYKRMTKEEFETITQLVIELRKLSKRTKGFHRNFLASALNAP